MQSRIYKVERKQAAPMVAAALIEATSYAQALRYLADLEFDAAVAKPKEIASMMAQGFKVFDATGAAKEPQ